MVRWLGLLAGRIHASQGPAEASNSIEGTWFWAQAPRFEQLFWWDGWRSGVERRTGSRIMHLSPGYLLRIVQVTVTQLVLTAFICTCIRDASEFELFIIAAVAVVMLLLLLLLEDEGCLSSLRVDGNRRRDAATLCAFSSFQLTKSAQHLAL